LNKIKSLIGNCLPHFQTDMNDLKFLNPFSTKNKVRLGPNKDGGYIVYQSILQDVEALVTYGVGWEVGFERHFNEITGHKVVMFDPTMFGKYILDLRVFKKLLRGGRIRKLFKYLHFVLKIQKWLNLLRKLNIVFVNEGLGIRHEMKYNTLGNHLKQYRLLDKQIMLKIDIEGAEYDVFENPDTYQYLKNVSQIIIEFHDLQILFPRFKDIVCRLKDDYEIIHIHGNNCGGQFIFTDQEENRTMLIPKVLELTLVQKGKIYDHDITEEVFSYPTNGLDYANRSRLADLPLNFI